MINHRQQSTRRPVRWYRAPSWTIGITVLAVLLVVAASGGRTVVFASIGPTASNTLNIGSTLLPSQMANMNPLLVTGNAPSVLAFMYNQLFYFNPVNGKVVPELATSGSWSDNYLTYTVKLNPKAKWSNGRPITGTDVAYTYRALKNPALDPYSVWTYLKSVSGTSTQAVFHLKQPFAELPSLLTTVYIIPHTLKNPATNLNLHPISSGPWEFLRYNTGTNIVLQANPHSFLGEPHFKYLNYEMFATNDASALAMLKGSIVTGGGTVPANVTLLKTNTNKMQKYQGLAVYGVFMNNKTPGLNNTLVRRAISLAVNRQVLITQGEDGNVFPANPGWLPTVFSANVDQSILNSPKYRFNLTEAKSLLTQAGYTPGPDGVMQKNGQKLSFNYYEANGAPAQDKEAAFIQGWLKQIGIATTPHQVTGPDMSELLTTGQYQLVQTGLSVPPSPSLAICTTFDSASTAPIGKPTPGQNWTRFENKQIDSICSQLSRGGISAAKTQSLYNQAQTILANDAPVALMYVAGGHQVYETAKVVDWDTQYPVTSPFCLVHVRPRGGK